MSPGAEARLLAAEIVTATLKRRQTLDQAFSDNEVLEELSDSDRGFVRAMVIATFRELGRIDAGLGPFLSRPIGEIDLLVLSLLRIGVAQMWRLETPAHAAVAATVAAAKGAASSRRASGLVNAVLRRVSENIDTFGALPAMTNWPGWLAQRFAEDIGEAGAQALAEAQQERAALHLSAIDPQATAQRLGGEILPGGSIALAMGAVADMDGYGEGGWWVQDAAAALPARILNGQPGEQIVDLCAAPGGKTMQLAASGAHVIAVDRSAGRMRRLEDNLERTGMSERVQIVVGDGLVWMPEVPVDAILLDAPCSALGTLARHPEGAWIKRPGDLTGYASLQRDLLTAALGMLKPGGRLIYCVCTPLLAEGREIVDAVIGQTDAVRMPITFDEANGFDEYITAQGDVLTVPINGRQHDAFYIARLISA